MNNDIKIFKRKNKVFVKSTETPISAKLIEDTLFKRWFVLIREPRKAEWKAGTAFDLPGAILLASAAIHTVAAGKPWFTDWDD